MKKVLLFFCVVFCMKGFSQDQLKAKNEVQYKPVLTWHKYHDAAA